MFPERTSVGLDVHARSVTAAAIDGVTGELFRSRLTPAYEHITVWLTALPGPVAVAYEAGPTGFELYRPPLRREYTICTARAPEAVFTVRTNATRAP